MTASIIVDLFEKVTVKYMIFVNI